MEGLAPSTCSLWGVMFMLPRRLDDLLSRGYMLPKGAEDEIQLIKRDLKEITAILSSLKDDQAMMARCWMKEVRELSYDMEDFVDQYEHATASSQSRRSISRRKITRHHRRKTGPLIPEKLKQRLWMANKIREFSLRVQEALQRHSMYNVGSIAATDSSTRCIDASSGSWHAAPCADDDVHVGISKAMTELEDLLMMEDNGDEKLKVVSIVGFGGVGKTTLANELYRKLGWQFECRAFVRTCQRTDMRRLFISMLSQVRPHQPPDSWEVHSLISSIRTHLQDKRYLIIVDDLWATSTWDIIKCALPDGNSRSRILTTTEIEDLALQSCAYNSKHVFKMKPLGEDDSRKLFFRSLFGSNCECPPELREVSNDIVQKCGGLPLAIVSIANLLASQLGIQGRWHYVNKSLGYSLMKNPTLNGMKQVLNLSYNNLPQHLKACMLYMSIYQEDNIIWKEDLVNQWIAEGLICATEEQDMQEISGAYFDELVGRKMIQPVDINNNGEVLSCVVHHMVINLVTYMSIQENFITSIHHSQASTTLADKVRRLSLHFGNAEDATPPTNMRLSQVRTLAFFGVFKCMPSLLDFRLLRVLILHFWVDKDNIRLDFTRISELFRLRYLKVTSNATLDLQSQIRGLQYLETLKIDARVTAVPSDITHLSGLLHLSLPAQTNLPTGIGRMTSLRTLAHFDLSGNSMENMQILSNLTNLRDLQLTCSTVQPEYLKDKMQFLVKVIGKLSHLKSITLVPTGASCANNPDDAVAARSISIISGDCMSSMSTLPILLRTLEFSPRICILSCLPKFIGQLNGLCILKIGVTKIAIDDVFVLRGLPALAVLSLYVHTKPAESIVIGKEGFSVLKYLKFKCCEPRLKFEADAMPNLQKLKLGFNARKADQQNTIPVGIEHLSGLKVVSVKIGGAGPEESGRRAAEVAFTAAMRLMVRAKCLVNIQCVNQVFGCMDGHNSITGEDESENLKQHKIMEEGVDEHDESSDDSRVLSSLSGTQATHSGHMRTSMHASKKRSNPTPSKCTKTQIRISDQQDVSSLDDGRTWRKYGQKQILGAKHPRAYFRCTHRHSQGCNATKQLQRSDADPLLFDIVYLGEHTCSPSASSNDMRSTRAATEATAVDQQLPLISKPPPADSIVATRSSSLSCLSSMTSEMDTMQSGSSRTVVTSSPSAKRKRSRPSRKVMTSTPDADGHPWRKYGQKDVLGAKYPRGYYRCMHRHTQDCAATKQVQRMDSDMLLFDVVYYGEHTCEKTAQYTDQINLPGSFSKHYTDQINLPGSFSKHYTDQSNLFGSGTTSTSSPVSEILFDKDLASDMDIELFQDDNIMDPISSSPLNRYQVEDE
uniref:WRKY domain-containing protein n=1 Tax=Arundo donax TaxID=35708 RepID=A0A0A9CJ42_ARUDO